MFTEKYAGASASDLITIWTAHCSNTQRTATECATATQELLTALPDTDPSLTTVLQSAIRSVHANRGEDHAFLSALFAIENRGVALGCLSVSVDGTIQRGKSTTGNTIDAQFVAFDKRFGTDRESRLLRLRLLASPERYIAGQAEVEAILTALGKEIV